MSHQAIGQHNNIEQKAQTMRLFVLSIFAVYLGTAALAVGM
ncbi:hypothetical protein [Salipiger sp. IMCC34102]|nr:hypothetical protein [Salipiger sp. IMCC34102]